MKKLLVKLLLASVAAGGVMVAGAAPAASHATTFRHIHYGWLYVPQTVYPQYVSVAVYRWIPRNPLIGEWTGRWVFDHYERAPR